MKNKNISGVSAPLLFFFFYVPRNSLFWIYIINMINELILKRRNSYEII
nr:MAG TPA: hypothetical protein [Caudoviricetes sp.]